jgi:hypothetical protein
MDGSLASDSTKTESILLEIKKGHLNTILGIIANSRVGLSNAAVDSALGTSSQWVIRDKLMKLLEFGLIEYDVDFFGEPGIYSITPFGIEVYKVIQGVPSSGSN